MVFCGKASLSCKNCRIRRIKCNKLRPECSQCIRAGKTCPGYRDQLSLMFRDETVKVRNKFQDPDSTGGTDVASSSTATLALTGPDSSPTGLALPETTASNVSTGARGKKTAASNTGPSPSGEGLVPTQENVKDDHEEEEYDVIVGGGEQPRRLRTARSNRSVSKQDSATASPCSSTSSSSSSSSSTMVLVPRPTPAERGWHFYVENYIFGHPYDAQGADTLAIEMPWLFDPATKPLAAAVGLISLANLTNNQQLREASRQHYLTGLQRTNRSLGNAQLRNMGATMRGIVLMAMFELARGDTESMGIANLHVKGAAALMRNFLPLLPPSSQPFRNLMQFCYSLLIPCYTSGTSVPSMVLEYVTTGARNIPAEERISTDLILATADLVNMSSYVQHHVLVDGLAETTNFVVQVRQLDVRLAVWEYTARASEQWRIEECQTTTLPPEACYHGRFHRYSDLPTARIWSYYRWTRILASELLLNVMEMCPRSTEAVLQAGSSAYPKQDNLGDGTDTAQLREYLMQVIRCTAKDVFVSTPAYWRHPSVSAAIYRTEILPESCFPAIGGSGATGLPPLLFHLQAASCAPGVPEEDWKWALNVVETVWAQLGMQQAWSIAEAMRFHRDAVQREKIPTS